MIFKRGINLKISSCYQCLYYQYLILLFHAKIVKKIQLDMFLKLIFKQIAP